LHIESCLRHFNRSGDIGYQSAYGKNVEIYKQNLKLHAERQILCCQGFHANTVTLTHGYVLHITQMSKMQRFPNSDLIAVINSL
jgi:hypothetical protein